MSSNVLGCAEIHRTKPTFIALVARWVVDGANARLVDDRPTLSDGVERRQAGAILTMMCYSLKEFNERQLIESLMADVERVI